ncbi:hypothetical protein GCM10011348_17470 [Marinobacterium nitratireducens]|uniref:Peptidoglycan-binding protein, CsiV n=1 Tax=Marinobacterium nitratireducens TaxID=518897 RepID=A0A918DSH5_9GAMM|nr:CsiV family protein [Marinobacterium nitratireducens]GGO80550.1 hypothetical protein GCM10011348_17470 [Marinobacterium nitratireducens]
MRLNPVQWFARNAGFSRPLFALLTMLFLSLPADAEEPWYKIEILVFAHSSPAIDEQTWGNAQIPRRADALELGNNGNGAYQRLPANNLVLTAEKNRLSEQADYRTLFHGAWYQPVSTSDGAKPVRIRGGKLMPNNAYELDGYVTLDLDEFLSIRPDLYYSFDAPNDAGRTLTANLKASRQVEIDEIHYIDHPLFGMLVVIQR